MGRIEGVRHMIYGTGIDLVEIARIERAIERNPRFLSRVFTEGERAYFIEKGSRAETAAGNFAAKEAVAKALGTGIRGFALKDIEIGRDAMGRPTVTLHRGAEEVRRAAGISAIHLSIAHERTHALAHALAWTGGEV